MTTTEKTYQHFAKILTDLLGNDTAIRLIVTGYMPLSLEYIGQSAEGNRLIAISHTGEQNGDLMRDPEMVFELHGQGMAEPLSFRNDYMGMMQEVYRYDDSGKKSFARTWFTNIKDQGFLSTPNRERLG